MIPIGGNNKVKINFKHFNNTKNKDTPVVTMCSLELLGKRNKHLKSAVRIVGHKRNRLNRREGRRGSLTQALRALGLNSAERKIVWKAFRGRVKPPRT